MTSAFQYESFDPVIIEDEELLLPLEPVISEADVENARRAGIQLGVQQGFEAGEKKAREELEKLFAQAAEENDTAVEKLFQQLATQFDIVLSQAQTDMEHRTEQMLQLTNNVWKNLMPHYFANHGSAEAMAVVEECLQSMQGVDKIVVEYGEADSADLMERLKPLKKIYANRTDLEFQPSDILKPSEVRLRWNGGYAERDSQQMLSLVDEMIEKAMEDHKKQKQLDAE